MQAMADLPSDLPRALVGQFLLVLWHTHHASVLLRDFSGLLLLLLSISSLLIARKQISHLTLAI